MSDPMPGDGDHSYSLSITMGAGRCTIRLTGSVDWQSAPTLQLALIQAALGVSGSVRVDLSGLEFADSSFLHLLLDMQRHCRARGTRMRIGSRLQPVVKRLFDLTGARCYFEFVDQALPPRTAVTDSRAD
ncbi:anti-sigma factor antagonist [Streptomyces spiroverticillatus]|nr:STAS domain-containing protein [Streptomyces finlayi]GHA17366.1 anti-sigma factor antagonist [Streptomyces spiroverticillatus]